MKPSRDIGRLLEIMAALRTPGTGCPWDLEQDFSTIAPYTLEEAYEVADAIARGDLADLREELGDLLLQVVFHARMAQEQGAFDFGGVVEAITDKLIRRHPHVFGDARGLSPKEVEGLWDRIKAEEKAERAARGGKSAGDRRAGRRAGGHARPHPRAETPGQGRQGRLRLERSAGGAVQDPRGMRRDRSRDRRRRPRQGRGRGRRSAVCRGQSGPPSRCRSGGDIARGQSEIRAALRLDRAGAGRGRASGRRIRRWPRWTRSGTPPRRTEK